MQPFGNPDPDTPPVHRRSTFLIPLIATVVVAVVVGAVVTLAVLNKPGQPSAVGGPSSAASPSTVGTPGTTTAVSPGRSPVTLIDPCLVGIWTVTSSTLRVPTDAGTVAVELTTPSSQFVTINADGNATDEYHHSRYQGSKGGKTYALDVVGTVHYVVGTGNGMLRFVALNATGTTTMSVDGEKTGTSPLRVSEDPVRYTCAGDTFTEHSDGVDAAFTRRT